MPNILGVYAGGHDPAACLLRDGQIAVMIADERLTRIKHGVVGGYGGALWQKYNQRFGFFPWASVTYCLEAAGLRWNDLDAIVVPHLGRGDCQIIPPLGEDASGVDWGAVLPIERSKIIVADEPWGGSHHLMHAMSAFYASPFDAAAVLVIDAAGAITEAGYESETGLLFEDRGRPPREIFKNRYQAIGLPGTTLSVEPSLGFMYEQISGVLGFVNTRAFCPDAGKTMGLAPYGRPNDELGGPWIAKDGFRLDFQRAYEFALRNGLHERFSFTNRDRALITDEEHIDQLPKDLAFKVQKELEGAVVHLARELRAATGARNLCLAGGVALNSVANGLISRERIFDHVWAQPAAADDGQSIGLAYYGHVKLAGGGSIRPIRHAFGGRTYPRDAVAELVRRTELTVEELADDATLAGDAAGRMANGQIIGWFQGGAEFGPRALGHRSILSDPRGPDTKDRINARVKFREGFRPFAPAVLRERAGELFDLVEDSPYMLMVAPVKPPWAEQAPAITHVDGTARVQTVDRAVDPLFHALISAFDARTGVPMLLNTSFNLRGYPIVETPADALKCFLYTDLDALYLGRFRFSPPTLEQLKPKLAPGWQLVAAADGTAAVTNDSDGGKVAVTVDAPWLGAFLAGLDGATPASAALQRATPDLAPVRVLALETVRRMLRAGALRLRVGSLWL